MLDKAFNFVRNLKYDGYQHRTVSLVYKFWIKSLLLELNFKPTISRRLYKPVIIKHKGYSSLKDTTWSADFEDMKLVSKYNKEFWFLLCVINIFIIYVWVVP